MCKNLVSRILLIVLSGAGLAGAVTWDRAAYWDARYPTHWIADAETIAVRDALAAAGYTILNADQLKTWMEGHIADQQLSVVVICKDVFPVTVAESMSPDCTVRRYLDAGGKIVFYGDIPFYNVGNPDGTETNWAGAGAQAVLGFNAASAPWDSGNTVQFTDAGVTWGLTTPWQSVRPTAPGETENLTGLATDAAGNYAAWVKHYVQGDRFRGFVRLWDRGNIANIDDIISVAEYAAQKATVPSPPNGAATSPTVSGSNVFVILDFTPGNGAIRHTCYFSDNYDDVLNRVEAVSLGEPPYKDFGMPTQYYVERSSQHPGPRPGAAGPRQDLLLGHR